MRSHEIHASAASEEMGSILTHLSSDDRRVRSAAIAGLLDLGRAPFRDPVPLPWPRVPALGLREEACRGRAENAWVGVWRTADGVG